MKTDTKADLMAAKALLDSIVAAYRARNRAGAHCYRGDKTTERLAEAYDQASIVYSHAAYKHNVATGVHGGDE